jgi:hypothetical protein
MPHSPVVALEPLDVGEGLLDVRGGRTNNPAATVKLAEQTVDNGT